MQGFEGGDGSIKVVSSAHLEVNLSEGFQEVREFRQLQQHPLSCKHPGQVSTQLVHGTQQVGHMSDKQVREERNICREASCFQNDASLTVLMLVFIHSTNIHGAPVGARKCIYRVIHNPRQL